MSQTGLHAFDSTLQTTNIWLNEIQERLGWLDRQRAYHALRSVLHALRDRLTVQEAVDLGAQLPLLVRGFYYEGWNPSKTPLKDRKKQEFIAHVVKDFANDPLINPEEVVRSVFQVLAKHVSPGEIDDVKGILPKQLKDLWSADSRSLWT
jgi:uncharacterized protein (DUF2267 family)